ncbi:MAG: hypothetical protein ACRDCE_23020, partial [Cetobacterium sp.]|uniref:hypothetical protein n=1 Tax=Cetobacterium sp. TaxID=2071632 RepID=UPI003EE5D73C
HYYEMLSHNYEKVSHYYEMLSHNYEKVSHYYEKVSHYYEMLSRNYEKVSHYYDLKNHIFLLNCGGNGLPYITAYRQNIMTFCFGTVRFSHRTSQYLQIYIMR